MPKLFSMFGKSDNFPFFDLDDPGGCLANTLFQKKNSILELLALEEVSSFYAWCESPRALLPQIL